MSSYDDKIWDEFDVKTHATPTDKNTDEGFSKSEDSGNPTRNEDSGNPTWKEEREEERENYELTIIDDSESFQHKEFLEPQKELFSDEERPREVDQVTVNTPDRDTVVGYVEFKEDMQSQGTDSHRWIASTDLSCPVENTEDVRLKKESVHSEMYECITTEKEARDGTEEKKRKDLWPPAEAKKASKETDASSDRSHGSHGRHEDQGGHENHGNHEGQRDHKGRGLDPASPKKLSDKVTSLIQGYTTKMKSGNMSPEVEDKTPRKAGSVRRSDSDAKGNISEIRAKIERSTSSVQSKTQKGTNRSTVEGGKEREGGDGSGVPLEEKRRKKAEEWMNKVVKPSAGSSVHGTPERSSPLSAPSKTPTSTWKKRELELKKKKEKSTDCDSALIPLLCVHG